MSSSPDLGRKALWLVRELGLPTIVRACVSCRSTRHHPSGKFRVNANGKLLDVWMLINCELCDRTSKIPIHERVHVQALDSARRMKFEDNDLGVVRELVMSASLASRTAYQLDWAGTWELETDMPFYELDDGAPDPEPLDVLQVLVSFELPAPIRVEKLLMLGFGLSRSRVRILVASGRIHLPIDIDAKVREDFTLTVSEPAHARPAPPPGRRRRASPLE